MTQTGATANDDRDDYQRLAQDSVIVSEKLCASLAIPAGARVLDIACGTGHTAIAAARRRAIVTGVDINERSLARARLRAQAEGLNIEFMNADGTATPFPDASFDYALSTVGLVFFRDKQRAAQELARVVKAEGVIALTAYTHESIPGLIYDLVNSLYKNPTVPAGPYYTWSSGPLAGELLGPYFHHIRMRLDTFDICFPSSADMFEHLATWNPPIRMAVEMSAPEVRKALREGCIGIIDQFNRAIDGTLMANIDYTIITAVRSEQSAMGRSSTLAPAQSRG